MLLCIGISKGRAQNDPVLAGMILPTRTKHKRS